MSLGLLADRNEVAASECEITSNVSFATVAPLEAVRTTPLVDAAVSSVIGTQADPVVIEIEYASPIFLTYAGMFKTNFRQTAKYRFEAFGDVGRTQLLHSTQLPDGRDLAVLPPLVDPATLRFGAANQFRGDLDPRDYKMYPTNIHVVVPLCRPRVLRWTFYGPAYRPDDSDDTGYRLGLSWASDSVQFARHVGSSGEGYEPGDEVIQTPGGGVWVEPGTGKRTAYIDRSVADGELRDRLFDLVKRVDFSKEVVWLPNSDLPHENFRYGGLFRRRGAYQQKYIAPQYVSANIELEEVVT